MEALPPTAARPDLPSLVARVAPVGAWCGGRATLRITLENRGQESYFLGVDSTGEPSARWPYSLSLFVIYEHDDDGTWTWGVATMTTCSHAKCPAGVVVNDAQPLAPGGSRDWTFEIDDALLTSGRAQLHLKLAWPGAYGRHADHA